MKGSTAQQGLSTFEIVAILVAVAIVAAMAIPGMNPEHQETAADSTTRGADAVRSAHASAIADLKRYPTVTELSTYVVDATASATPGGIEVAMDQSRLVVPTFSDPACIKPTSAVDEPVACLGNL